MFYLTRAALIWSLMGALWSPWFWTFRMVRS